MTRTLVIMRHAKAEQLVSGADFDRPLTARGRSDATAAGAWLAAGRIAPQLVICSPAARTRATWHGVAIGFADGPVAASPTVRYEPALYDAGLSSALDLLRAVPAGTTAVLLIGHNPAVSALSARLDDKATGLRTAGLAVHDVTTAWADLAAAKLTRTHTARAA
jgi:phosphohistidine phosphatase